MPKIDITADEQTIIGNALAAQVQSAKRAQKTGKTPHIQEVYKIHERALQALENKIMTAKDVTK